MASLYLLAPFLPPHYKTCPLPVTCVYEMLHSARRLKVEQRRKVGGTSSLAKCDLFGRKSCRGRFRVCSRGVCDCNVRIAALYRIAPGEDEGEDDDNSSTSLVVALWLFVCLSTQHVEAKLEVPPEARSSLGQPS